LLSFGSSFSCQLPAAYCQLFFTSTGSMDTARAQLAGDRERLTIADGGTGETLGAAVVFLSNKHDAWSRRAAAHGFDGTQESRHRFSASFPLSETLGWAT
jgi:hypothetical protein